MLADCLTMLVKPLLWRVDDKDSIKQHEPVLASVASNTRPCFCIPVWTPVLPLNHQRIHPKARNFSRSVWLACLSRRGRGRRKTTSAWRTAGPGDAQILWRNARKGRNDAKLLIKNTRTSTIDEGKCVCSNYDAPVVVWAESTRVFRLPTASVAFPPPIALVPIQEERLRCMFSFLQWVRVSGHLI